MSDEIVGKLPYPLNWYGKVIKHMARYWPVCLLNGHDWSYTGFKRHRNCRRCWRHQKRRSFEVYV